MNTKVWGSDLALGEWNLGKDVKSVYTAASKRDYAIVSGVDNIAQAITLRLLTPRGSYAHLGHRQFGSRLFELVGELNNEINRKIAELYTREALRMEKRITSINAIKAVQNHYNREIIDIHISVTLVEQQVPLNMVVPFDLEIG